MRETTSQTSFRFSSATLTPGVWPGHFSASVIPGWFDKFLPWRQAAIHEVDQLALLCPSEAFIADLPLGKIPDRSDFSRLHHEERVRYWEQCVERSKALAEEFAELISGSDPLRGVTVFD